MNELLTPDQLAEIKYIQTLRSLYKGEHEIYFKVGSNAETRYEYVTVNWLGDVLTNTWARFVFRKFPRLLTKSPGYAKFIETLNLAIRAVSGEIRKSYAGKVIFKGYYSDFSKRPEFILWGAKDGEYAFPWYMDADRSKPYRIDYYYTKVLDPYKPTSTCTIREQQELIFNIATWEIAGVDVKRSAHANVGTIPRREPMNWNEVWKNDIFKPLEHEVLPLPELPVAIIHNVDRNGDGEGDTDFTPTLINLQKNLNKLVAVRQLVIDLSESPWLKVPAEYIDPDTGQMDMNKVRLRVSYEGEEGDEIQVTSWTGNLENSDKQWTEYRKEFYALTGISPALTGALDTEGRSGVARRLAMVPSEAQITLRRHQWERGLNDLIRIATQLQNAYGTEKYAIEPIQIKWADAIPNETVETSTMVVQEYINGLRTLESAIRCLPLNEDITEEEVQEQLKVLKELAKQKEELESLPPGGDLNVNQ